jgi:hypothetical protein
LPFALCPLPFALRYNGRMFDQPGGGFVR